LTVESLRAAPSDVVGLLDGPLRQTLVAAIQVLPQGIPLVQRFRPSAFVVMNRAIPTSANRLRFMVHLRVGERGNHRQCSLWCLGRFCGSEGRNATNAEKT